MTVHTNYKPEMTFQLCKASGCRRGWTAVESTSGFACQPWLPGADRDCASNSDVCGWPAAAGPYWQLGLTQDCDCRPAKTQVVRAEEERKCLVPALAPNPGEDASVRQPIDAPTRTICKVKPLRVGLID